MAMWRGQVKDGSVTKHKFRRFYAGSEAVVAGRVLAGAGELAPHIYGVCGVGLDDVSRVSFYLSNCFIKMITDDIFFLPK